jgi:hypothetical protein
MLVIACFTNEVNNLVLSTEWGNSRYYFSVLSLCHRWQRNMNTLSSTVEGSVPYYSDS